MCRLILRDELSHNFLYKSPLNSWDKRYPEKLTVYRQMIENLSVNRQNDLFLTVNRQRDPPLRPLTKSPMSSVL